VATAAGLVVAACTPVTGPASASRPGPPPIPALTWRSCDGGFQCATARVPLDYRHPRGMTIRIAVIRHLATGSARPIGSLFVNRGGPAAQIDGLVTHYGLIPAALRARFDIISFDPRGFGHSTAVRCFPTTAAENSFFAGLPGGFPVGAGQQSAWEQTFARFGALCAQRNGRLLDHDSTADVARDMDLLRQAVGDPALNYLGLSYGTGLGATYANLFPDRVGRLVLDGNLDPVAWTHGNGGLPTDMRLGSDLASAATLKAFLDLCGKAPAAACAFSAGTAAATRAKFSTLLDRLREHPVIIGNPPQAYTYASAVASVPLGDVAAWPGGARLLQRLWTASAAGQRTSAATQGPGPLANGLAGTAAAPSAVYTGREQQLAVFCSDSPNPQDPRAYAAAAQLAYERSGVVGPENAWFSDEQCAGWPSAASQDRYAGPWNRPTASPILLIGNTGDPRTSYQDSVAMSHDLARARLLTVDGYGHTEFDNPSTCAINHEVRYFLAGTLPPAGTICRPDEAPFPRPGARTR
jgi:pimeloyl-ACP methyl ester carboxylesterase